MKRWIGLMVCVAALALPMRTSMAQSTRGRPKLPVRSVLYTPPLEVPPLFGGDAAELSCNLANVGPKNVTVTIFRCIQGVCGVPAGGDCPPQSVVGPGETCTISGLTGPTLRYYCKFEVIGLGPIDVRGSLQLVSDNWAAAVEAR